MDRIGFLKASDSLYQVWSGRFFSHTISLLIYFFAENDIYYKIFTFFFMIAFIVSVFFFVKVLGKDSISLREKILITVSIFFLYLYSLPAVSQGFYWLISVPVYNNSLILVMLFVIFYIGLYRSESMVARVVYMLLCCFTGFCIGGSNEIAMIFSMMLLGILILFNFKKLNWYLIFITMFLALGSYIDIRSPGTKLRHLKFPGNHNLPYSIFHSFTNVIENVFLWIFTSPLIPVTILLIPVLYKLIIKSDRKPYIFILKPIYSIIISFIFLYAGTFVFYLSIGHEPFPRSLNVIYFIFLFLWFYNVITIMNYLSNTFKFNFERIPKFLYAVSFVLIVFFLFLGNNVKTAYTDLFSGTAARYDKELNDRYEFINNNKSDTVFVEKLKNNPFTIKSFELTPDPNEIYNQWYSSHFKKKSIILKKEN